MILTLEQYRALSGDTASSDAFAQRMLDKYTSSIETFCGKPFGIYSGTERHVQVRSDPVVLNYAPLMILERVTDGKADFEPAEVHWNYGRLHHHGQWIGLTMEITYSGGQPAPVDVQEVLVNLVREGISGDTDGSRQVSKEVIYGVESVSYGASTTSHPILGAYTDLLRAHRYIHVA